MNNYTLRKIAEITSGRLYGGREAGKITVSGVVSDSRAVKEGSLFLCIPGRNADGHDFAQAAIDSGAAACIMEHKVKGYKGPYILVDSVKRAAIAFAEYYRRHLKVTVVGITGSVGKTSAKEFIASVLSESYRVHKTQGNFNNDWGVPFTIFGIDESDDMAVLEAGVDGFGQMDVLASMIRPDICVMTNIGQSHLENFGTRENIYKEKSELFKYMDPAGAVILNGDDDILSAVSGVKGIRPLFFGSSSSFPVCAENIRDYGYEGSEFDIAFRDGGGRMAIHVKLSVPGVHMVYSALAAAAVGLWLGMPPVRIKRGIEKAGVASGHNDIIKTDKYVILDDCYNASPMSVEAALDTLKASKGRKVAVLGDMLELGKDSEKYHFQAGKKAAVNGTDVIICVGPISEKTYLGAKMNTDNTVEYYKSLDECLEALPELIKPGDTILVKASHSMDFSRITRYLAG